MTIEHKELKAVYLNVADAERRNRTGAYKRRHTISGGSDVTPNEPSEEPADLRKPSIPEHVAQLRSITELANANSVCVENGEEFSLEPAMICVPISDLTANLLRPCYHRDGFGTKRIHCFAGEPSASTTYSCICCIDCSQSGSCRLEIRELVFDTGSDSVRPADDQPFVQADLLWAAAVVPLVKNGEALSASEIAKRNYDLRQILGRHAESEIQHAYAGWFDEWNQRVDDAVSMHESLNREFASFYHSIIAIDEDGNIRIMQQDGALPDLAVSLQQAGIRAAGLLDSGGSCAIYDVWMASYLNHGWYFREPRGAVLLFVLETNQKLPKPRHDSWLRRRLET